MWPSGLPKTWAAPTVTPEYVAALGSGAEERGFASIWVPEHVVLFGRLRFQVSAVDHRIRGIKGFPCWDV